MTRIIAAINMTLDGVCDHRAGIADAELHEHYAGLIRGAGMILYGRITYQLMEYWRTILKAPTGEKAMDDFAVAMDKIPKLVFSNTLKSVDWHSAKLATNSLTEQVSALKREDGPDVLVGSRSLIISLSNMNLVDELQLCVQPILAGEGMLLFDNIERRNELRLVSSKLFQQSGSMVLYYAPKGLQD